ncbi:MAG: hypothetical protein ACO27O_12685, partial [Hylemonella sp.]
VLIGVELQDAAVATQPGDVQRIQHLCRRQPGEVVCGVEGMQEGRQAVGATASPDDWRVGKSIFVGPDEATAKRYALQEGGPYHFYFKQLVRKLVSGVGRSNLFKTAPNMPDSEITPDYVTQRLVLAGTVNSVVDQILAFREQVGDFGTLVYACHDWQDKQLGQRSMELFATEVMPRVNKALGQ